jgi:hypothetical protein
MPVHVFTVVVDREPTDDELDRLLATSRDDPGIEVGPDSVFVDFRREAPTLAEALVSAVRDLEAIGLRALRVIDEDLLTLADIADRIGRSRESVRRYAIGARGGGAFPPPVSPERDIGTAFYRWSEVAPWLRERLGMDVPDVDPSLVVANLVLQARWHRDRVPHMSVLTDLLAA